MKTDSLIFKKTQSNKGRSISISRGVQVKTKAPKMRSIKGFVHTFTADSLTIITKKGLRSIRLETLKFLLIFHGPRKQIVSSELISKGAMIAIPAALGLTLAVRETLIQGDYETELYLSSATFGASAVALILTGSLIRRKKLRMIKWSTVPIRKLITLFPK